MAHRSTNKPAPGFAWHGYNKFLIIIICVMPNILRTILAASLTLVSLNAAAQPAAAAIDLSGNYDLASSTTVPASNWGYTKARIGITPLDAQHWLIVFACEWKREPKAVCGDFFYAQQRDGGVYLQDMNTDSMRLYFDPASRTLTMISRGADAKASVRRDVFKPTTAPLTDPALLRRYKREQRLSTDKDNLRVFGPYTKWAYQNNRIEFQHP